MTKHNDDFEKIMELVPLMQRAELEELLDLVKSELRCYSQVEKDETSKKSKGQKRKTKKAKSENYNIGIGMAHV